MIINRTLVMGMIGISLILWGCGGGSSSPQVSYNEPIVSLSGNVADGYLIGAKVCLDKNNDGLCGAEDVATVSGVNGNYTLMGLQGVAWLPILVEVNMTTVDQDTQQPIMGTYTLKKALGQSTGFISPLTTLVASELDLNRTLTLEQAHQFIQTDLGLSISLFDDYIGRSGEYLRAHTLAQWIAKNMVYGEQNIETNASAQGLSLVAQTRHILRLELHHQIRQQLSLMRQAILQGDSTYVCTFHFEDLNSSLAKIRTTLQTVLTQEQQDVLSYMWNEEKMARDVYRALYRQWGVTIFDTIAKSEQLHMDMVASLSARYGMTLPTDQEGVFSLSEIQSLYATLISQGTRTSQDALRVGQIIEQTDIADLDARLALGTQDMQTMFIQLKEASLRHLSAFNRLVGG